MNNMKTDDNKQYTSLRITKELHKQLREAAKKNYCIFYQFTENLLKKALENHGRN